MKEKLIKVVTDRRVLSAVSLILMGLTQLVSGKVTEEDTREIVRDELEKRKRDV